MNAIPARLDHLVHATPDLAATVADFTARTGVAPAPGGAHVGLGTRNHLVALGGSRYLEIIGPDPGQPEPARPRPFGIDALTEARTVTWAIGTPDVDAAVAAARAHGYDPGPAHPMSRRRPDGTLLAWRLTRSEAAHPSGLVPFLIDWGATVHPTASDLPAATLVGVSATVPDPDALRPLLAAVGTSLALAAGPVGLRVTLDTRRGRVTL
ncbi:VOC family protein [Actinacidiphila sp. ITFR-21]|uniref:VOC family protein n=1 Tax=Actinacidiphila sp. ITFR-21 TaxID=3075199 RepID=UPI00288B8305|nr:VOC family protein [Streptomyces sp. ITFR-21]WNI16135.1 VOC family protein [Streptomyces sp. ITFR-21]